MLTIREHKGIPSNEGGNDSASQKIQISSRNVKEYIINKNGVLLEKTSQARETATNTLRSVSLITSFQLMQENLKSILSDLFLPLGYPESVESTYIRYQFYDSLQGLCSYLRGVVSTSAVLSAAGVGKAEVTALSAAVTWALRDGIGMMGGLLFSYISASHFDSHVKEFRLFADVINDVGLTLDMLAPIFPSDRIIYVSAIATVCKVMCGMAAGATKASITSHFALRGNLADLNAKESTQETLVTLLGMTFGISLAKYLNNLEPNLATNWIWFVFCLLTIVHVWANYRGVMLLRLNTLNRQRAEHVLGPMVASCSNEMKNVLLMRNMSERDEYFKTFSSTFSIPTPNQVTESIVESTKKLLFPGNIRLGASIVETCCSLNGEDIHWLITEEFVNDKYILGINISRSLVYVTLKSHAVEKDELIGLTHALLLSTFLNYYGKNEIATMNKREIIGISHRFVRHIFGHEYVEDHDMPKQIKNTFTIEKLEQFGWNCQRIYLGFGKYRIDCRTKHD